MPGQVVLDPAAVGMISGEELCLAVGEYAEGVAFQVGSADGWPAAQIGRPR